MNRSKVRKCISMVDNRIINVALNGKLLQEVELFKYLESYIEIDREINEEVKIRMNEVVNMCEGMKKVL